MTNTAELTLTDFLLARIAEDEVVAKAAREHEYLSAARDASPLRWSRDAVGYGNVFVNSGRVLAESAAKRRIIESVEFTAHRGTNGLGPGVLFHLASVYADHPDYRQEWRA